MTSDLFFGGIPTKPDVDALIEEFGVPEVGVLISYEAITKIISVEKDENRFKSVTGAWKKQLEDKHNVIMQAISNKGYECMSSSGRIAYGSRRSKSHVKAMNRTINILISTPKSELSADELAAQFHWATQGSKARMAMLAAPEKLIYPELDKSVV